MFSVHSAHIHMHKFVCRKRCSCIYCIVWSAASSMMSSCRALNNAIFCLTSANRNWSWDWRSPLQSAQFRLNTYKMICICRVAKASCYRLRLNYKFCINMKMSSSIQTVFHWFMDGLFAPHIMKSNNSEPIIQGIFWKMLYSQNILPAIDLLIILSNIEWVIMCCRNMIRWSLPWK